MVVHPNRFYLFKNTIGMTKGLFVEMMRACRVVWDAYIAFQDIQGKEKSDVKELEHVMKHYLEALHGKKKKRGRKPKDIKAVFGKVEKDFKEGNKHLTNMILNLDRLMMKDETFLYRKVVKLKRIYKKLGRRTFPEHLKSPVQHGIFQLMHRMLHFQKHCWVMSKAETKGKFKFANVSLITSRKEKNRLRRDIMEASQLERHITDLDNQIDHIKNISTPEEYSRAHDVLKETIEIYHKEFEDVEAIMHESHILMHRTEKMLHLLRHEAETLNEKYGIGSLVNKIRRFQRKMTKISIRLQKQSLREYLQIKILIKKLEHKEVIAHPNKDHTK